MHGAANRVYRGVARAADFICELDARGRQQCSLRRHHQLIVVARWRLVFAMRLDDRKADARCFHVAIAAPDGTQKLAAADFEPHEVIGVIHHTHLVGFSVAHTNGDALRGLWGHHEETAAASFKALVAAAGSDVLKMAEPATTISTPASTARAMFDRSMPPSISIGAFLLPARSSIPRIAVTFCRLFGMNFCPPKPGFTDITRMKSTSPAISSRAAAGVDGLSTTPALTPRLLMNVTDR